MDLLSCIEQMLILKGKRKWGLIMTRLLSPLSNTASQRESNAKVGCRSLQDEASHHFLPNAGIIVLSQAGRGEQLQVLWERAVYSVHEGVELHCGNEWLWEVGADRRHLLLSGSGLPASSSGTVQRAHYALGHKES